MFLQENVKNLPEDFTVMRACVCERWWHDKFDGWDKREIQEID